VGDWVYHGTQLEDGARKVIGRCIGRVIGNHHLGVGEPREVDVLKGEHELSTSCDRKFAL